MAMFLTDLLERGLMSKEEQALIKQAVVVRVQNVCDYISQTPDRFYSYADFPNVACPFPIMWMEWNQAMVEEQKCRSGLLVVSEDFEKVKQYIPDWVARMPEEPWWICTAQIWGEIEGEFKGVVKMRWAVDGVGEIIKNGIMIEYPKEAEQEPDIEESMLQTASFLTVPWMALSFMHCKNVKLEKSEPIPEALQAARRRRGKPPLVRFHTLTIAPVMSTLRKSGIVGGAISPTALHICRGHFKDFTMHGLFGKHKGVYWWPMAVKGDRKQGIVVKDYEVKGER